MHVSRGSLLATTRQGGRVILEASSRDELRNARPTVDTLPEGSRGQIIIKGPFLGPVADLAFAEQTWARIFTPSGVEIIDVHGDGFGTAVIDWRVPRSAGARLGPGYARQGIAIATVAFVGLIIAALLAAGWLVNSIRVLLFGDGDGAGIGLAGLLAIAGVAVVALSARRRS